MSGMGRRLKFAVLASAVMPCMLALGAPSASADSQDDYFLQRLEGKGVWLPDDNARAHAIDAGKSACYYQAQGFNFFQAEQQMQAKYPKVDTPTLSTTMPDGILVYCPEYLGR